jgi:hypothetical protein
MPQNDNFTTTNTTRMTTFQTVSGSTSYAERSIFKTIAWVGLLVGSLDILCACLQAWLVRGIKPVIILQYIASGAFGKMAFSGGSAMALTGLLFHFIIAYSFTTLFFLLYPSIRIMSKSVVATAIVYGIFIFAVMNLLVLPLTKIPKGTFRVGTALIGTGILIVAIGLPLAIIAKKYYRDRRSSNQS